MSKINKVQVDNIIYDIEDSSIPSWARENEKPIYNYEEIENLPVIPSKTSELENDKNFIENNQPFIRMSGRVHAYNNFDSNTNRIDISAENIQGADPGGSRGTLYINRMSDKDVRILEKGTGTLYYKNKEVATQEYVDEKIADIEVDIEDIDLTDYATKEYVDEQISNIETGGGITELPIASATTLGGIKVGANLTIDEDGTLNAMASGSSGGEGGNTIAIDNLPIGAVVAYDGEEIPYGYEEVEDYMPTYSLEEKRVGTWIDGLPIYRKVIVTTTPSTANSWVDVAIGVDNIKEYISYSARFETSGLTYFADIFEDSTHKFMAVAKSNAIAMTVGTSNWCSKPVTLIIEYTKTTDEVV